MTTTAKDTLLTRFENEVKTGGLADVKFFVRRRRVSAETLAAEINLFEDKIRAGDAQHVASIDGNHPKKRFDAPFE